MMGDAVLTDRYPVTRMVGAVHLLVGRNERIRLIRSPQILDHFFYRLVMLAERTRLELIEPREEEGGTS